MHNYKLVKNTFRPHFFFMQVTYKILNFLPFRKSNFNSFFSPSTSTPSLVLLNLFILIL